ncbi:MAG: hypothetical protein U5R06_08815 [candidate division KSB1 bacterium]|nr:hypothetical protein [candidate division KSB1 bacterium]
MMRMFCTLLCLIGLTASSLFSQSEKKWSQSNYRHSIETSPLSPLLQMADKGIWGIKYEYALTPHDELKVGLAYMNIHFDEGNTNSPGLILGYRRYVWKKLYIEYELWPCYDAFYEKNEDTYYRGFDLWNEFRLGYQFNFQIKKVPMFVNVAWPFGFGLYSINKPDSFYDRMNQGFGDKYYYQFPLIFVGLKF